MPSCNNIPPSMLSSPTETTASCSNVAVRQRKATNGGGSQSQSQSQQQDSRRSRKKKIVINSSSRQYPNDVVDSEVNVAQEEEDKEETTTRANSSSSSLCELCGECFPSPVTIHMMHQCHPGCGLHSGGKGYNSRGVYCLGWAGNCGEGRVILDSSWYILCEVCRERYVKTNRGGKHGNSSSSSSKLKTNPHRRKQGFVKSLLSPCTTNGLDIHVIMKNNAMFLLDLASSADISISHQRRSSTSVMPSVLEHGSPPPESVVGGPFSTVPPFQCLHSLGVDPHRHDSPFYEELLRRQTHESANSGGGQEGGRRQPLSEVSSDDPFKGTRFHRSVSMGTNGAPWIKTAVLTSTTTTGLTGDSAGGGGGGRVIMLRRRNNSSSELGYGYEGGGVGAAGGGGSSLLCHPSAALLRLVPHMNSSSIVASSSQSVLVCAVAAEPVSIVQRPVMQFLLQQHDLESLQLAMKQALRKAMCRVYAMQAMTWLLKSVTQPVCLHDLLWWFVTSLSHVELETESEDDNKPHHHRKVEDQEFNVCEHPLSDISIAGEALHPLPSTFHTLLQTIADLMVLLPVGSALQQMAVRCWGLRFTQNDHSFLHRSQVFSNISRILSRSEEIEDTTVSMHESSHQQYNSNQVNCIVVESFKDLTQSVDVKASSRQAMVSSLTDDSTETFWESGDEDRNKTKSLTITCAQGNHPI